MSLDIPGVLSHPRLLRGDAFSVLVVRLRIIINKIISLEGQSLLYRRTISASLRVNRCSVDMFARSQTIVCLQANIYLTTGKHPKMVRIAPRNKLLCSTITNPLYLNGICIGFFGPFPLTAQPLPSSREEGQGWWVRVYFRFRFFASCSVELAPTSTDVTPF